MVPQLEGRDDDDDDERERFPQEFRPATAPLTVQIRLDDAVAPDTAAMALLRQAIVADRDAPLPDRLSSPLIQLLLALRTTGAVSLIWPLDDSPELDEILTPEELMRRRAIIEISFRDGVDLNDAARALRGVSIVKEAVPIPDEAPPACVRAPDRLLGADDQNLMTQWYVFRVRAPVAWEIATGKDVVVGDVDFGFRTTHQDLGNIELDKAFNSHDGSNVVDHGTRISHGTAVLGLVGAANNRRGIIGIAFESRLWPIQANSGPGVVIPGDKWARGIDYILKTDSNGRRKVAILEVQLTSGHCYEMKPSANEAIRQACNHGVVVVTAAGNGALDAGLNTAGEAYPDSGSIIVGATSFHQLANPRNCSSNFGDRVSVSAPGYGPADLTCGVEDDECYRQGFGGTSGAAPKVAGACALMLEADDSLTHSDVKTILIDTGSEVLTSPNRPAGVFLDVGAAVTRVKKGDSN